MKINVMLDEGAYMPTKAHEDDAGFDIYTPKKIEVPAKNSVVIDTGVHFEIPKGYVGILKSKSGLNIKDGINVTGVIDSGYTGSVVAKIYNHAYTAKRFEAGNKITQIVFLPIPQVTLELSHSFEKTERGDNGFGSTGE